MTDEPSQRREGHSRLVFDKTKRTIVAVDDHPPDLSGLGLETSDAGCSAWLAAETSNGLENGVVARLCRDRVRLITALSEARADITAVGKISTTQLEYVMRRSTDEVIAREVELGKQEATFANQIDDLMRRTEDDTVAREATARKEERTACIAIADENFGYPNNPVSYAIRKRDQS